MVSVVQNALVQVLAWVILIELPRSAFVDFKRGLF
jgi:hypothetical protein